MSFKLRATGLVLPPAPADTAEVRRALAVLADPKAGIQLQVSPSWRHRTFAGNDLDAATKWAIENGEEATAVYYAINPVSPDLKGKVKVGDVLRRRWLLVDVDRAKNDSNRDLSATEDERQAALKLAAEVRGDLLMAGWPDPVIISSGNGQHLLYRIDLPNDDASRVLCRRVLHALAKKWDGDRGNIGKECHDARRIAKLPGTWARKGPETEDRPHRLAMLTFAPQPPLVVREELLLRLAEPIGYVADEPEKHDPPEPPAPLPPFVLKVGMNGNAGYVAAAVRKECDLVRSGRHKHSEGRNNALNAAAFSLGQLVAGRVLDRAEAEGELIQAAVDAGLDRDPGCGERGIRSTIKSGIEAGMKEPRGVPHENGKAGKAEEPAASAPGGEIWALEFNDQVAVEHPAAEFPLMFGIHSGKSRRVSFNVRKLNQLLAVEFPDPNWAIPGLLAEGLNLLAGAPKSGKSMMALNLALTVAGGGHALGNIRTLAGDVLYLSLEDKDRRVQWRAKKMSALIGQTTGENLSIVTRWPRMDQGGIGLLKHWLERVKDPRLVIFDVLSKFRTRLKRQGDTSQQDADCMNEIKDFADNNKLTALVLAHTRKKTANSDKDDDEFEDISGTIGLTGACDGILKLKRARRSNDAQVSITGRDDEEQQLALQFDPPTLTWTSLGTAEELLTGKLQIAVVEFLKARSGHPVFASEIVERVNGSESSVRKTLYRLEEKGIIRKQGNAWAYPGPGEIDDPKDTESF